MLRCESTLFLNGCPNIELYLVILPLLCSRATPSNFILYPKEDKDERKLVYYCRSPRCDHEEDAPDPYVFRNQVIKTRT
jgi:hypothetical protein